MREAILNWSEGNEMVYTLEQDLADKQEQSCANILMFAKKNFDFYLIDNRKPVKDTEDRSYMITGCFGCY